jgi:hypothetical protein
LVVVAAVRSWTASGVVGWNLSRRSGEHAAQDLCPGPKRWRPLGLSAASPDDAETTAAGQPARLLGEAALADSRLPSQQDHAAATLGRRRHAPVKERQLGVASHQVGLAKRGVR